MIEVTQEQFFAYVGPRDIHPRHDSREHTDWETRSRVLVGRSYPGWANPGDPRRWQLTEDAARTPGVAGVKDSLTARTPEESSAVADGVNVNDTQEAPK